MSSAGALRCSDTWNLGRYFCGGLRREFLTLLFVGLAAQSVGAQLLPPPPNQTTCDEAIKVANEVDGKLPLVQTVQYDAHAVDLCKQQKGTDHVDTLGSVDNLAITYSSLGRHNEASKLREETLVLRQTKLGADHPDTLASLNRLAVSYG